MTKRTKTATPEDFHDLISQADAARLRGHTRAAIGYLVTNKKLRSVVVFGRRMVYKSEVESFEASKPGPKESTAKKIKRRKAGTKK